LYGVIGSGKTVTLRRLQQQLKEENKVIVSKSLAVEKHSIKLGTLIAALFYDLSTGKQVRIPTQGEKRERELRELVKKSKRPVALFVDEAHDLNAHTLTGLKRLMEVIDDGGGRLSVVLAGWPKLRNDLRRPSMEEIGFRTDTFSLDGITGSQREYIHWLLSTCTQNQAGVGTVLTEDAIDLLASRLRTALQIEWHLTQALEAGYQTGESPVSAALVETVLSKHLDDIESVLTRQGYGLRELAQNFEAKPAEIKALFVNQLDPVRSAELRDRMRLAGLPI
jgi:type II secretory pathway predicted ATPase ExeA